MLSKHRTVLTTGARFIPLNSLTFLGAWKPYWRNIWYIALFSLFKSEFLLFSEVWCFQKKVKIICFLFRSFNSLFLIKFSLNNGTWRNSTWIFCENSNIVSQQDCSIAIFSSPLKRCYAFSGYFELHVVSLEMAMRCITLIFNFSSGVW